MTNTDQRHDFDFIAGRWTVRNRYLRERLKGSNERLEFETSVVSRPLLGGVGNEDEYLAGCARRGLVHERRSRHDTWFPP